MSKDVKKSKMCQRCQESTNYIPYVKRCPMLKSQNTLTMDDISLKPTQAITGNVVRVGHVAGSGAM